MKTNTTRAREIEALKRLLDSHGADRTRWPARERLRFANLAIHDPEARRLMAEAAALDSLLDRAPVVAQAREIALAQRIVATAVASGRPAAAPACAQREAGGNVLDLSAARQRSPAGTQRRTILRRNGWGAAGLLAASLLLGVLAGVSGMVPSDRPAGEDFDMTAQADEAGRVEGDWL